MDTNKQGPSIDRIIELCERAIAENPNNATAHHDLGVALFEKRDIDGALLHLQKAVELAPKSVLSHYLLGIAYAEKTDLDSAIPSWKRVLELDKRNSNKLNGMVHYFIGKVYGMKGMWDAASMELKRAKKLLPEHYLIKNAMAEIHLAKGELSEAKQEWLEAAELNKEDPRAALNVCAIALDTSDYQLAIEYGQRVVKMGQDSASVRFNLGIANMRLGNYEAAIRELQQAVKFEPQDLGNRLNLGEAYVEMGRVEDGIKEWEQAASDHPESAHPYYNIGVAYARNGALKQAEEYWQKGLVREPRYLPIFLARAASLAEQGRLDESLTDWQQALELEPDAAIIRLNMMSIYLRKGQPDKCLGMVTDVVKDNLDIRFVAALAMMQKGQANQAFAELSTIQQSQPDVFARHVVLVQEVIDREWLQGIATDKEGVKGSLIELFDQVPQVVRHVPVVEEAHGKAKESGFWANLLKALRK